MLLKWITLRVPPAQRAAFSDAQAGWQALAALPGFRWQVAGWDAGAPDRFGALALWDRPESYRAFMAGPHDALAAAQAGLYDSIETRLAEAATAFAAPDGPELQLDPDAPDFALGTGPVRLRLEPRWRVARTK